LFLLTCVI